MPGGDDTSLADLTIGEQGEIVRVCDQHPERLRYLAELGLVPGAGPRGGGQRGPSMARCRCASATPSIRSTGGTVREI